jgi:protein-disulfide isomerase
MALDRRKLPRLVLPRVGLPRGVPGQPPRERRTIYIVAFFMPTCPHCHEVFFNEDSAWNRALRKLEEAEDVEVEIRWVDVSTELGRYEAQEAGVDAVPAVFVNGERLPTEYLYDERRLLDVLYGRAPIAPRAEPRRWWPWR